MKLEIPSSKIDHNELSLEGKLTKHLEPIVDKTLKEKDKNAETDIIQCSLTTYSNADISKVRVRITHPSKEFLNDYKTKKTPKSIELWSKMKANIKEAIKKDFHVDVIVSLEGWKEGSIIIDIRLENVIGLQDKDIESSIRSQVILLMPNCGVEVASSSQGDMNNMLEIALRITTVQERPDELIGILESEALNYISDHISCNKSIDINEEDESDVCANCYQPIKGGHCLCGKIQFK